MKKTLLFSILAIVFCCTSCIEIIDDLSLNLDGSGTLKYSVNLSSSKVKINSILALDSLDGKPVPSRNEIADKIADFKSRLEVQKGISNVEIESDFTNYLFKLKCDFDNIDNLQNGLKAVAQSFSKGEKVEELQEEWVSWNGNILTRSIPDITIEQTQKIKSEDVELLKQGSYTSITRFAKAVTKFDNPKAVLSKNQMAVMVKADPYSLIHNTHLLENKIYLAE